MARPISTGASYGLTVQQTKVCMMMAEGMKVPQIIKELYGASCQKDRNEYERYRKQISKWQEKPGWDRCFAAYVRQRTLPIYSKAVSVMEKQLDSDNEWVAQGAARDVLSRYGSFVMEDEQSKVTITIEGMPQLGMPGQSETP